MLQSLFVTSVQPKTCNFFLGLLIRWMYPLLSTCGIWLVGISLSWSVSCSLKRLILAAHISNIIFSSTNRHSKSVWLHALSYSNTCCTAWWLYQTLILDNYLFFLLWKFRHLSALIQAVCEWNLILFWWFLHGVAFFYKQQYRKERTWLIL